METILVRYDGKYEEALGGMESWTVRSHTMRAGRDLFNCTFGRPSLTELLGAPIPAIEAVTPGEVYEIRG